MIIYPCTYSRNTSGNRQRLHCPSSPDYPDTTSRSPQFPPQTGVMAPNRVPSATCGSRWHNAYRDPFCQLHK